MAGPMTTAELARIARDLVPPVGMTGVCLTTEHEPGDRPGAGRTWYRVAWLVDGRRRVVDGPRFDRPRDAGRLYDLLTGTARRSVSPPSPPSDPAVPTAAGEPDGRFDRPPDPVPGTSVLPAAALPPGAAAPATDTSPAAG